MVSDGHALTALCFEETRKGACFAGEMSSTTKLPVFDETRHWLDLYFVWDILLTIPYGKTMSYGDVARRISPTMSAQAIGGAVGRNPIGIIIPCHRVIGADGSLTGYGGGLERKRWMLEMEMK